MKTTPVENAEPSLYETKLRQRRFRWQWNTRLLVGSVAGSLVALLLATGSYFYHSATTASTFLKLAETAQNEERFSEQAKWLQRYSLLVPDDVEVVYDMALATDEAAMSADRESLGKRVHAARKSLSGAIARIEDQDDTKVSDLRQRLLHRLLQLGGSWNREAEQQVIALAAAPSDPQALSFMARALVGQLKDGSYKPRSPDAIAKSEKFWGWLSNQQVGYVLGQALKQNPDELDLIVSFLFTPSSHPNQFKSDSQVASLSPSQQKALRQNAVTTLQANPTSRAQLALCRYFQNAKEQEQANDVLKRAADQALGRLESGQDSDSGNGESQAAEGKDSQYWDFVMVAEASRQFQATDPDASLKRYRFLMSMETESISPQQREEVYLATGNLLMAKGETEAAMQAWRSGLEKVDHSILLLRAIAQAGISQGQFDKAQPTLSQLSDAIDSEALRLSRATEGNMIRSQRIALGRRLDTARWHLSVLRGYGAAARNEPMEAIGLFQKALRSDADIASAERVSASIQLANLHGRQGSWDQAAAVLDRATLLAPQNPQLGRLAVEAWTRSGNQTKAIQQWGAVDEHSSWDMQIASIEARLQYQRRLLPEQRDLDEVRFDIHLLRGRLQSESTQDTNVELRASVLRYLESLQLMIPPQGVAADEHFASDAWAKKMAELSQQHPKDSRLQTFTAEKLAQANQRGLALLSLDRLAAHPGTTPDGLALIKARVFASLGDSIPAAKQLIEQAQKPLAPTAEEPPTDSSRTLLLQTAASFAARGGDGELAYQALAQIPEKDQTLSTLFAIATLANRLPGDSIQRSLSGQQVSARQLTKHWGDQLRDREGANGTYWRFYEASNLLTELQNEQKIIEKDDPRLAKARSLVERILSLRSRWGDAISLNGWISVIEGEPERAVRQLRRGMAAGDMRLRTRQLLWEQLISLGRGDEAEREIRLASRGARSSSDRYSASRIDLAIKQGDFTKSMQVATESAKAKPTNALVHLVVAATGTTALQNVRDESERQELLTQTRQAIAKAEELAGSDDPRVLAAHLRLAFALDDETLVQASMQKIKKSGVVELAKNRMLGQAHVALKQYDQALPLLTQADQLDPSSRSQLSLAELYRLLKRPDDEIKALRLAQQRDESNGKLRNRLAKKLVAQSADGKPLDWEEINELLSGSDGIAAGNRLMHAVLLGSEGLRELKASPRSQDAVQRLQKSKSSLRSLINQQNRSSDDATRFLAMLLQEHGQSLKEIPPSEQKRLDSEVRSLYETLYNRGKPRATDLYRYASYLLNQDDRADNAKIENLLKKLNSTSGGTLQCLEVGIRLANRKGERNTTPSIVADWADTALAAQPSGDSDQNRATMIFAAAGSSLLKLGFTKDSIEWFERAYQKRPETLGAYILALVKAQQTKKAMQICVSHFAKHHDASSAKLFLELLLSLKDPQEQADLILAHQELLDDAVSRFDGNVTLLEGIGTLRMAQGEFESATTIFQRVLKKNPLRIRALNNLAMALAEIPGRASEGLGPINQALKLGNQNSELLDTKGVVLMASGQASEAEDTFAKAFLDSREPRHQFHVIVAQLIQGKEADAFKNWKRLDLKKLDPSGLTSSERMKLKEMKKKFGSQP